MSGFLRPPMLFRRKEKWLEKGFGFKEPLHKKIRWLENNGPECFAGGRWPRVAHQKYRKRAVQGIFRMVLQEPTWRREGPLLGPHTPNLQGYAISHAPM